MPDLRARFAALIIAFAPLFVQRSWLHARVLTICAILALGRRMVVSVPPSIGLLPQGKQEFELHPMISLRDRFERSGNESILR